MKWTYYGWSGFIHGYRLLYFFFSLTAASCAPDKKGKFYVYKTSVNMLYIVMYILFGE